MLSRQLKPASLCAALVFFALMTLGCIQRQPASIVDEGPRFPDLETTVSEISFDRLVTDEGKAYRINREVESFTTRGHKITPLLRWNGRYIHAGLNSEGEVVWIAGIGIVPEGESPQVLYTGVFDGLSKGRLTFKDGTVLRRGSGVKAPAKGADVLARIDPKKDLVLEVQTMRGGEAN